MTNSTRATRPPNSVRRTRWVHAAALFTSLWMLSCAPSLEPPPEDYDSLLRYLFTHMMEESTTDVAEGAEQLIELVADEEVRKRGEQGHSLASLSDASVDGLDETPRTADDLMGLGVLTVSPHSPVDIACTLIWEDFGEIVKENFEAYSREFDEDPTCFCTQTCTSANASSDTKSNWAGLIQMEASYRIQFRWLDSAAGPVLLHRFWLKEPAGEPGGVNMQSNFYLGVTFADGTGGATRVHASWFAVDLGTLNGAEDLVFGSTIDTIRNDAKRIDDWISENGTPMLED